MHSSSTTETSLADTLYRSEELTRRWQSNPALFEMPFVDGRWKKETQWRDETKVASLLAPDQSSETIGLLLNIFDFNESRVHD